MGTPKNKLWVTNTGNSTEGYILLSAYKPIKKEDGKYHRPENIPLFGHDIWIPNCIGLKREEGVVKAEIVRCEEETGIWLICVNDYFGNEQHLFVGDMPIHLPLEKRPNGFNGFQDWVIINSPENLHISTTIGMVAGDGPYSVKPKRKSNKR